MKMAGTVARDGAIVEAADGAAMTSHDGKASLS
jgi:hypothetical protein